MNGTLGCERLWQYETLFLSWSIDFPTQTTIIWVSNKAREIILDNQDSFAKVKEGIEKSSNEWEFIFFHVST